jgi:hypothetical protein
MLTKISLIAGRESNNVPNDRDACRDRAGGVPGCCQSLHAWVNHGTETCRILFVLMDSNSRKREEPPFGQLRPSFGNYKLDMKRIFGSLQSAKCLYLLAIVVGYVADPAVAAGPASFPMLSKRPQ